MLDLVFWEGQVVESSEEQADGSLAPVDRHVEGGGDGSGCDHAACQTPHT